MLKMPGAHQIRRGSYEERVFESFAYRVQITDTCWLWLGGKALNGYGVYCVRQWRIWSAHKYSFLIFKGPTTDGLTIDHSCNNRLCVNPAHLREMTHAENIARARVGKGCPHGEDGKRQCPECQAQSRRKRRMRLGLPVRVVRESTKTTVHLGMTLVNELKAIAISEGHQNVSRLVRHALIKTYGLSQYFDGRSTQEAS